jgi:dephospho-CoA kinase
VIIAITGNIGSGKSVVARYLTELCGAMHCDTDLVCRNLLEKDQPGWVELTKRWGKRFLDQGGNIDRKSLRAAVFNNEETRRELESILHPHVHAHVTNLIQNCRRNQRLLIVEVPLLFEVGWQNDFDYVVTVSAEQRDTVARVVTRDNVPAEQVEKILNTQMSITDKAQCSDFVIDNSGSLGNTYAQIELLKAQILSKRVDG